MYTMYTCILYMSVKFVSIPKFHFEVKLLYAHLIWGVSVTKSVIGWDEQCHMTIIPYSSMVKIER